MRMWRNTDAFRRGVLNLLLWWSFLETVLLILACYALLDIFKIFTLALPAELLTCTSAPLESNSSTTEL